MIKIRFLIAVLALCLVMFLAGCARRQAPAVIDLREALGESPEAVAASPSPRYASYYKDDFILTVLNKLADRVEVEVSKSEVVNVGPGQRTDIFFKKGYDCRKVILTAKVLSKDKLAGTTEREQWIPPQRRRSLTTALWIIESYDPLRH